MPLSNSHQNRGKRWRIRGRRRGVGYVYRSAMASAVLSIAAVLAWVIILLLASTFLAAVARVLRW